ncbi:MAG: helix-turn-helix domain-containing protein [Deltaproteobacteria bacterium]|nr:helix-turn-helix domain-containing protein [Deltaproteobacteria bacterium]
MATMIREIVRQEIAAATAEHQKAPAPEVLTTEQAAEIANVTPATVRQWVREGSLRATRIHGSRQLRILRNDLLRHLCGDEATRLDGDAEIDQKAREIMRRRDRRGSATPSR